MMHATTSPSTRRARAFTLTEILVAVVVLVVVIAATAQIFGTASRVAGLGQANQDLLQESSVVERMIRSDLERLATEGYMVVQGIAVRNDAQRMYPTADPNAPLLDATKLPGEYLRADRIVFFATGQEDTTRFLGGRDQGDFGGVPATTLSRISYGHAVQLPDSVVAQGASTLRLDPVAFDEGPLTPWSGDNPLNGPSLDTSNWTTGAAGPRRSGRQPEARDWILARSATLLAHDGGSRVHLATDNAYGSSSAISVIQQNNLWQTVAAPQPSRAILSSRVDAASSTIESIQRTLENGVLVDSTGQVFSETVLPQFSATATWNNQIRGRILGATFGPILNPLPPVGGWPRAEKVAPTMDRSDQILVAPMIAGNCSSVMVDWTWDRWVGHEHVGDHESPDVTVYANPLNPAAGSWNASGYVPNFAEPRVWYGLPDGLSGVTNRGVYSLTQLVGTGVPLTGWNYVTGPNQPTLFPPLWDPVSGIGPQRIEGASVAALGQPVQAWPSTANAVLYVYSAVFGFKHTQGVDLVANATMIDPVTNMPRTVAVARNDVTPLPSALRFTIRLHDKDKKVEGGREFQFVVELTRAGGRER
ncbi:MAG: prepilin-type N-terminal cleavage/methylation domain-containing protein [Planctomycetota bacterium]|nr:prepilin-type N-terminal cleavage/methylation domain-containing protein [Planctomycetota bacterium]